VKSLRLAPGLSVALNRNRDARASRTDSQDHLQPATKRLRLITVNVTQQDLERGYERLLPTAGTPGPLVARRGFRTSYLIGSAALSRTC
jgi:hypothetical protein